MTTKVHLKSLGRAKYHFFARYHFFNSALSNKNEQMPVMYMMMHYMHLLFFYKT
ncbi:hypothetical protein J4434_03445 [Candidatus Woesearchaeota archaeon]|nr:hypothetical protein [Candidatus Woesearchaeota archaeon]